MMLKVEKYTEEYGHNSVLNFNDGTNETTLRAVWCFGKHIRCI